MFVYRLHIKCDIIILGLANSILPHRRCLKRVDNTDMKASDNKCIAIVSRGFKTNDEPVFVMEI